MALPLTAPMPPDLDLVGGYSVEIAAIDPTTGAPVANVVMSEWSIYASSVGVGEPEYVVGPFMLVPGPGA